jgi:hypothetical protein
MSARWLITAYLLQAWHFDQKQWSTSHLKFLLQWREEWRCGGQQSSLEQEDGLSSAIGAFLRRAEQRRGRRELRTAVERQGVARELFKAGDGRQGNSTSPPLLEGRPPLLWLLLLRPPLCWRHHLLYSGLLSWRARLLSWRRHLLSSRRRPAGGGASPAPAQAPARDLLGASSARPWAVSWFRI